MRPNANPQPVARATGAIVCVAVAQLLATSLWFSVNGTGASLMQAWQATRADIGLLTNAVQLGFIAGTFTLALSGLADRFTASRIFVCCALLGALCNAAFAWLSQGIFSGAILRALVGLCLAGVYPLGMKLIVSWNPAGAGASLALLVGMLTLGTALPHALRALGSDWAWQIVISGSSVLAVAAAGLIFRLGDGPYAAAARTKTRVNPQDLRAALRHPAVRAAFLGYFGHMWELYAFWTLVPMLLVSTTLASYSPLSVAALSFIIIAIGALGCLVGGYVSQKAGSVTVAAAALAISALCCLLFPWMATAAPLVLLTFMLMWGAAVIADSPQFSAMVAQHCPAQALGSALALQNALGFALSVLAISISTLWLDRLQHDVSWLLLPGPVLGLLALASLRKGRAVRGCG